MHGLFFAFAALLLLCLVICQQIVAVVAASPKQTMIWLCLERCGDSAAETKANLETIAAVAQRGALTAVSFERYDLTDNSQIVLRNFTDVHSTLKHVKCADGSPLRLMPMITTVRIDRMRQVFQNPAPLFDQLISEAAKYGYTGYNIDWEPEQGVEEGDAAKYAEFLGKFARAMQQANLQINVDVASWGKPSLYNFTSIAQNLKGLPDNFRMITMDTYAFNINTWITAFQKATNTAMASGEPGRVAIGLDTEKPLSQSDIDTRFSYINNPQFGVREVDVWVMTQKSMNTTSYMWTAFEKFLKQK